MQLKLVNKKTETKDTVSFYFSSDEKINFEAGQYIYITLLKLNYPDERGDTRHFTISNSPSEGDLVRITTKIREESGYKKTLNELPIGSVVEGRGPQGTFLFEKNIKNNIFLAGGIGITPFRSMIKYNIYNNLKVPMFLIYSNSDSDFVFKKELDKWQEDNDNLKINYHDSSISGHLDTTKLSSLLTTYSFERIAVWIVGPPSFVNAMEDILEELKMSEDHIKTEKFIGY